MQDRTLAQTLAMVFGIAFLGAGILGFIPGITTNYSEMKFAGGESGAELLGIFQVSVLHNIVHGLFGLAGLALAKTASGARAYLIGGGAIYILLALVQVIGAGDWVPLVGPDLWLHLALGVGMIGLGYGLTRDRSNPVTT